MKNQIYKLEEIKKLLEDLLKDKPVYKVILFGSYAKNTADENSDIDLIIDTKNTLKGFAFLKLISQIKEKLLKEVDIFEKYEIESGSKIDKEIKETGVIIYEK